MSTRAAILRLVSRRMGYRTGDIASGTANTAVLSGLINTTSDDYALKGWTLMMPDAANETDKERVIDEWDASSGTASWLNARSDTTYTSETYIVIPPADYQRIDMTTAINDRLNATRRTVKTVIPTIQGETIYHLTKCDWLRSRHDVDGVTFRFSPNLVDNGQFDNWKSGSSSAPTQWTLAGSGATVARTTSNVPRGAYGVTLTRVGAGATLTQSVGLLNGQLASLPVTVEAWVTASVASRARVGISDGTSTTYSSYHTGGSTPELLSVTATLASSASACDVILSVDTGDTSATFAHVVAQQDSAVTEGLQDNGDGAFSEGDIPHSVDESGGVVTIKLGSARSRGAQLVVYTAQPYPSMTSDSDSTDCPDSVIVPGAVYEMVRGHRKGDDRTRLDRLQAMCGSEYTRSARNLRQKPAPVPVLGARIVGA